MGSQTNPRQQLNCPYCKRPLDSSSTREHVFGNAYGSSVTIRACEPCNSRIGTEVEGQALKDNSVLAFVRATYGLASEKDTLRAEAEDGSEHAVDFSTWRSAPAHPTVEKTESGDEIFFKIAGHPEHVKKVLKNLRKKYGDMVPSYADVPEEARQTPEGEPPWMNTRIGMDLGLAERQAAKIALASGTYIWPRQFPSSSIAEHIRERLWLTTFDPEGQRMHCEALDALWQVINRQIHRVKIPDWRIPSDTRERPAVFQTVFVPQGSGTFVFVHILNMAIPPYGVHYEERIAESLPVILRESDGEVEVWKIDELITAS